MPVLFLLHLQLTCGAHAVQPAVPAFFTWLNARLPSLELVNIEFEDFGDECTSSVSGEDAFALSN